MEVKEYLIRIGFEQKYPNNPHDKWWVRKRGIYKEEINIAKDKYKLYKGPDYTNARKPDDILKSIKKQIERIKYAKGETQKRLIE